MFFLLKFLCAKPRDFQRRNEIKQFSKNITRKKLTEEFLFGIRLNVTKVTVFETSDGTAKGVVTLQERAAAERFAVAMTPIAEAERLAKEDRKIHLSAWIKTGSALWEGPAEGEQSRSTKVEPRCRERNRRWRTATNKNYLEAPRSARDVRFVKTSRVLTGERRPPIARRNTNWWPVFGQLGCHLTNRFGGL